MTKSKFTAFPMDLLIKTFVCIVAAATTLYVYIEQQNSVTVVRLAIPALAKEVRQLHEENIRLQYEINQFESPIHLMELARKPEFGHLKYPYVNEIITVSDAAEAADGSK